MHKRLIEEGFNRRYVLLPMLLSIALVLLGYTVIEVRRSYAVGVTQTVRERQDLLRLLGEAAFNTMEAESSQRGFLLTGEEKYLRPLEASVAQAVARLDEISGHYRTLEPEKLPVVEGLKEDLAVKTREMRDSVELLKAGDAKGALALVKSGLGLYQMQAIGDALDTLRVSERAQIIAGIDKWNRVVKANTIINTCNMGFTLGILIVLGLLATRDIRRRNTFATQLATQIDTRTSELRDLSLHMSRVAETEKHALARELHDELGGLLVAMRMDVSQIRKRLAPTTDPDMLARWERIEQALAQGIALKRRVIEDLRPTLLDNMGLFTALQWLASQSSEQAQLSLHMEGLEEDIEVPPETAIAVFRTVQEAISNVVKHSGATQLWVKAREVGPRLMLEISDDGRGVPPDADRRVGSHGLRQMRFRMDAVGGDVRISSRTPQGTSILLSVPLEPQAPEA